VASDAEWVAAAATVVEAVEDLLWIDKAVKARAWDTKTWVTRRDKTKDSISEIVIAHNILLLQIFDYTHDGSAVRY